MNFSACSQPSSRPADQPLGRPSSRAERQEFANFYLYDVDRSVDQTEIEKGDLVDGGCLPDCLPSRKAHSLVRS